MKKTTQKTIHAKPTETKKATGAGATPKRPTLAASIPMFPAAPAWETKPTPSGKRPTVAQPVEPRPQPPHRPAPHRTEPVADEPRRPIPSAKDCPLVLDGEIAASAFCPEACFSCEEFDCRFSVPTEIRGSGALRSRTFAAEDEDSDGGDDWGNAIDPETDEPIHDSRYGIYREDAETGAEDD
ncbi:MAG: hypothetical protein IJR99_03090 [Kiritimatiellae bacterium]|nr:hypothetical protein [Kiritimatiellia bacterium]